MGILNNTNSGASPDKIIIDFLLKQNIFTLATAHNDKPYCAPCFYAFIENYNALVFKSNKETDHIIQAQTNKFVAGTVLSNKFDMNSTTGLQFCGIFLKPEDIFLNIAKHTYYRKYPFAAMMKGELWVVELNFIKFSSTTLGIPKKIKWTKPD